MEDKDKISIYFDIDGVLGRWYPDGKGLKYPEQILDPRYHYFRHIEPQPLAIQLAKDLVNKDYDVCIISAADSRTIPDKNEWIDEHLPFIDKKNIFFCPLGYDKTLYIKGNSKNSVLIDDFPKNLKDWDGIPVKALNDINSKDDNMESIYVGLSYEDKDQYDVINQVNNIVIDHLIAVIKERNAQEHEMAEPEFELDR